MNLDSIPKIERFLVDSIMTSPLVPLGVNVMRLADTDDTEGIVNMTQSITVRYTSSDVTVVNRNPMFLERRMTFEVTIAAQSYLTQSGHDAAVQMCAAVYNTIGNKVPPNSGLQTIEPFHILNERFDGLTNSSHYVYVQEWQLIAQDAYRQIAIDPCVLRGNCNALWNPTTIEPLEPGDVLYLGAAYEPVLPPPPGQDYEAQYKGVQEKFGGDLVYTWNTEQIFLNDWTLYNLVPTGTFDTSGKFLIINVYKKDSDVLEFSYFGAKSGRRVLLLSPASVPSSIGAIGDPELSGYGDVFTNVQYRNGYVQVNVVSTKVYKDPSNPSLGSVNAKWGTLFKNNVGAVNQVTLTVGTVEYTQVSNVPSIGVGWVIADHVTQLPEESFAPILDCTEETISDGVPGGGLPNNGVIESCE